MNRPPLEVADIVRSAGSSFIERNRKWINGQHEKVLAAILGGLADFNENPGRFAIRTDDGQLASVLMPLASDTITCIFGFTELGGNGAL
jgi:hypothetical protein